MAANMDLTGRVPLHFWRVDTEDTVTTYMPPDHDFGRYLRFLRALWHLETFEDRGDVIVLTWVGGVIAPTDTAASVSDSYTLMGG